MTQIVIAGSRGFEDYALLEKTLNRILANANAPIELVSGHAKGADLLAERYAVENSIPICVFKPDWKTYGRAVGPIRWIMPKRKLRWSSRFGIGRAKGQEIRLKPHVPWAFLLRLSASCKKQRNRGSKPILCSLHIWACFSTAFAD